MAQEQIPKTAPTTPATGIPLIPKFPTPPPKKTPQIPLTLPSPLYYPPQSIPLHLPELEYSSTTYLLVFVKNVLGGPYFTEKFGQILGILSKDQ